MEEEKLCLKEIKELGFNDKLIKLLLSEPELKTNPRYKKAAPMKLWKKTEIEKAMKTEAFKQEQEKIQKRKLRAEKAVQTKTKNTLSNAQNMLDKISVKRKNIHSVKEAALSSKQQWYDQHDFIETKTVYGADDGTIERWTVNYIRHKLTTYDIELESLFGQVGKDRAHTILHNGILQKIAEVYPELKEECERQMNYENDYINERKDG